MKKTILKRTADFFEKLAAGSILVGVFQEQTAGIWVGVAFIVASYFFTMWEAKK